MRTGSDGDDRLMRAARGAYRGLVLTSVAVGLVLTTSHSSIVLRDAHGLLSDLDRGLSLPTADGVLSDSLSAALRARLPRPRPTQDWGRDPVRVSGASLGEPAVEDFRRLRSRPLHEVNERLDEAVQVVVKGPPIDALSAFMIKAMASDAGRRPDLPAYPRVSIHYVADAGSTAVLSFDSDRRGGATTTDTVATVPYVLSPARREVLGPWRFDPWLEYREAGLDLEQRLRGTWFRLRGDSIGEALMRVEELMTSGEEVVQVNNFEMARRVLSPIGATLIIGWQSILLMHLGQMRRRDLLQSPARGWAFGYRGARAELLNGLSLLLLPAGASFHALLSLPDDARSVPAAVVCSLCLLAVALIGIALVNRRWRLLGGGLRGTADERMGLGAVVVAVDALPKGGPWVSRDKANAIARRLWGPMAATYHDGRTCYVGRKDRADVLIVFGQGTTWSAAFRDALQRRADSGR